MNVLRMTAAAMASTMLLIAHDAGVADAAAQIQQMGARAQGPSELAFRGPNNGRGTKGGGIASTVVPVACEGLDRKVPQGAIQAALEEPALVSGWGMLADPGKPKSWNNDYRRMLNLSNPGTNYHELYNGLVFRSGCR